MHPSIAAKWHSSFNHHFVEESGEKRRQEFRFGAHELEQRGRGTKLTTQSGSHIQQKGLDTSRISFILTGSRSDECLKTTSE